MCLPIENESDKVQTLQAHMRSHIQAVSGMSDTSGIEIASLVRMIGNLYEAIGTQKHGESELSGPRWGLLLRLMVEEKRGNCEGITPTSLSHFQNVSKNTISALLRGLEEQGLIERALDPEDHRIFRILLTQAGRDLIETTGPKRLKHMNQLASCMSEAEREELVVLLGKLYRSVLAQSNISESEIHGG